MKTKKLTLFMSIVLAAIFLATPLLTSCGSSSTTTTTTRKQPHYTVENGPTTPSPDWCRRKASRRRMPSRMPSNTSITNSAVPKAIRFQLTATDSAYDMSKVVTIEQAYMNEGDSFKLILSIRDERCRGKLKRLPRTGLYVLFRR